MHPVAGLQTPPGPGGGHRVHLVVLGAWVAAVAATLLVDHLRTRRGRPEPNPGAGGVPRGGPDRPPTLTAARGLMATWPPPRLPAPAPVRPVLRRPPAVPAPRSASRAQWLALAAAGSLAAAATHAVVMPDHLARSPLYGAFFAAALLAQGALALLLVRRPGRSLLRAGMVGNLSLVVLWAYTRAAAFPLGPDAGGPERIGPLDLVAVAAEVLVVAACAVALREPGSPARVRWSEWRPGARAVLGALAVAVAVAGAIGPRG